MGPWSFYLVLRTIIGSIDCVTDFFHGSHLIYSGHPIWGWLTLLLPFIGLCSASIYVLCGKCRRGDPMSLPKFCILCLASLTNLFEAFFESIPQIVLQCTAIWRGVVRFEDVFRNPDFWGILGLFSMLTSLLSIVITASFYNDEKWDGGRSASKFMLNLGKTKRKLTLLVIVI